MNTEKMNAATLRRVVKELSRDPQVKRVIAKGRRQSRGKGSLGKGSRAKGATTVESLLDTYLLLLAIAARFSRKKKARALEKHMDLVRFLTQASLLLKENILDRPEVRKFFRQSVKRVYSPREALQGATRRRKRGR